MSLRREIAVKVKLKKNNKTTFSRLFVFFVFCRLDQFISICRHLQLFNTTTIQVQAFGVHPTRKTPVVLYEMRDTLQAHHHKKRNKRIVAFFLLFYCRFHDLFFFVFSSPDVKLPTYVKRSACSRFPSRNLDDRRILNQYYCTFFYCVHNDITVRLCSGLANE